MTMLLARRGVTVSMICALQGQSLELSVAGHAFGSLQAIDHY